jgi:hypothetical protein
MGYYREEPPPHGHRKPSELAEDELLSSFHGKFCGMPATADEIGPSGIECSGRVEAPLIAQTSDVAKAVADHKVTTRTFVFG